MDCPNHLIVLFDGTFDGLLTVIYNRFYENIRPAYVYRDGYVQQMLGAAMMNVETDYAKSAKVYDAIVKKISNGALHTAYQAHLRDDPEIFTSIYRYIIFGFKVRRDLDKYMKEDFVLNVQSAAKNVSREANLSREFIRFKETKSNVLYAEMGPVNNVLPIVANHFANRFLGLKWIITDKKRGISAVSNGEGFLITDMPANPLEFMDNEDEIIALFKAFHKTIAVESRINEKLQTQLLPKRYRRYLSEFQ